MPLCKCKASPVTHTVWCPTWISAYDGPINVCDQCVKVFTPENENSERGHFFFGDDARKMFETVEKWFIPDDVRLSNVIGMLFGEHSTHISGHYNPQRKWAVHDHGVYVVDGKVWMICGIDGNVWVCRFGNYDEVKQRFPKLWNLRLVRKPN